MAEKTWHCKRCKWVGEHAKWDDWGWDCPECDRPLSHDFDWVDYFEPGEVLIVREWPKRKPWWKELIGKWWDGIGAS